MQFDIPVALVSVICGALMSALTAVVMWAFRQDKKTEQHALRLTDIEKKQEEQEKELKANTAHMHTLSADLGVVKNDVGWIRKTLEERHK